MTLPAILASGPHVSGYHERLATAEITAQWLASEWGTGGHSVVLADGRRAMVESRPSGLSVRTFDGVAPLVWSWAQCAAELNSGQARMF